MKPYQIIKHVNSMDVAFLITKVRGPYPPSDKVELTGEWINLGFVESYRLGIRQKIRLTKENLSVWLVCAEPDAKCLRYVEWK